MFFLIGGLVLLFPAPSAARYQTPAGDGCTISDRVECYFEVYCFNNYDTNWDRFRRRTVSFTRNNGIEDIDYDENGMPLPPSEHRNECPSSDFINYNGNFLYKIRLKYKDSSIVTSDPIPRENRNYNYHMKAPLSIITHLDLSSNEYNNSPNLKRLENLSFLNLSSNYLTTASLSNPSELPALTSLDLSFNMINTIELPSSGNIYRNLKNLNISHNYLVDIPDAILDAFTQLETLDLSHNYIDALSISTFEGIKKLMYLYLSHNRLSDINYSLFRFTDLIVLDLSHNRIESLKLRDFEKLSNLQTIDLSFNSLVNIETAVFWNMHSLVTLNLHENKLKTLNKDTFLNATSLKNVDISKNSFNVLPRGLFKGKELNYFGVNGNSLAGPLSSGTFEGLGLVTSLDLSYQHLASIEDNAFLGLENVKIMLLNNNEIQTLSNNCFRGLRNLNTLNLSNNNITSIQFDAQDLINLRFLVLSNNLLTQIEHENFQGLTLLNFLDLSNNKISKLESNSFKSLRDLINFEVSNNPLTGSLEEKTFDGLTSLPSLVISCTQLTTIENGSFIGMTQLKELNMSQSKINELQYNAFVNTGAIEEIDLSYNQLRVFEVNATELANLRILLLNKNLLKTVSSTTFVGLSHLATLNLAHNTIKDINDEAFQNQPDLTHLDLSYNLDINFTDAFISKNKNLFNLLLSGIRNGITFANVGDTQLTGLEIRYSGLTNVSAINLRELNQLKNVDLSNNEVVKLEVGAFTNLTQLTHLDVSNNKLEFIQPGVFKDSTRLSFLNISHNSLTAISYGIFRGLIYLNTLDMSFNAINSLESERFYEVRSLSVLIVDHNKIDTLNIEDFAGTSLSELSIGDNPLPCELLVNFKKQSVSFAVTAIKIDEHTEENVDGVTCNMNGQSYEKKSATHNFDDKAKILFDIKELLTKILQQKPMSTQNASNVSLFENTNLKYLMNISKQIDRISFQNDNYSTNFKSFVEFKENSTELLTKETKQTNILLDRILSTLNKKSVQLTTPFPISKDNASNDLILYINKVKEDLENALASEKLNIISELDHKISVLKAQSPTLISRSPVQNKLMATKDVAGGGNKSIFTETCVALILIILVCLVLYKFYKSRMFVRARRSYSTRELPGAMESQNL
ncbi:protein artichoke-like [Ostrinia furnacalis]|uniref:protein artichoke-like n=1 Tax=Ostrinia furnacalis TaxID=93504 RepID=UPI00103E6CFC|nr:protein artichoke-like [Ostrinia furnacalis]